MITIEYIYMNIADDESECSLSSVRYALRPMAERLSASPAAAAAGTHSPLRRSFRSNSREVDNKTCLCICMLIVCCMLLRLGTSYAFHF